VIVFLAMIKVIAVKFLIAKSLKLGHRYLISVIYMLFLRVESFQQIIIVIEEVFEELKVKLSRIVNKAILIARHPV